MNVEVLDVRQINTDEMHRLQNHMVQLWMSQQANKIKLGVAKFKTASWMAANGFTKIVNNSTNNNVVEVLRKGSKIAVGISVGTSLLLAPTLPIVPMVASGVTLGSYMAMATTKALHNITSTQINVTNDKVASAQIDEAKAERVYNAGNNAYKAVKAEFEAERERVRAEQEEVKQAKREQRREEWEEFKQDARDEWNSFKQDIREDWNSFKQDVREDWEATKEELAEFGKGVKQGIADAPNKAKNAFNKVVGAVQGTIKNVQSAIDEAEDNAIRKKREKEALKEAQEEARKKREREREFEKAQEKTERKQQKSKKCLNFLMGATSFLGKDFIASHLLTEEDKKSYNGVREAIVEERNLQAERINSVLGTSYSGADLAKMSDKQIQRIEGTYATVSANQARKKESGATL